MTAAIEVVRGRLGDAAAQELLTFWAQRGVLQGDQAQARLAEVVCLLRVDGQIEGACSVFSADVEIVGGRRFFVYRSLLDNEVADQNPAMVRTTFEVLDAERQAGWKGDEFGLCLLLDPAALRHFPVEADWRDPRCIYVGYLPDGRQVRIAYFSDQVYVLKREGGWDPPPGYRVEVFAEQDDVTAADVVELWTTAGMEPAVAEQRVSEVVVVTIDPQGRPIGVSTAYLARNAQLAADFWHFRLFVAEAHRAEYFSTMMTLVARDHLERRFASGEDTRAIGMIFEIQYEPWKRLGEKGLWSPSDELLIGNNARGDHVRVHYFGGALTPGLPRV